MKTHESNIYPLSSANDLAMHFDNSIMLLTKTKELVEVMDLCDEETQKEIRETAASTMRTLMEGFALASSFLQKPS